MAKAKIVKLSKAEAANKVVAEISGKTSLLELTEKADALCKASGVEVGEEYYCWWYVKQALQTAEALGVLELTYPEDILVTPRKK